MHDRRLFVAALLANALGAVQLMLVGTYSPALIRELGDPDLYGGIAGGYLVATVGGAIAAAALPRLLRGRALLYVGLVILTVGLLAATASVAMWQLVFARIVAGAGAGIAFVAAVETAGRGRRPSALLAAAFGAGFALGPAIGGLLTETVGWRSAFLLSLAVSVPAIVLVRGAATDGVAEDPAGARRPPDDPLRLAGLAVASAAVFVVLAFLPLAAGAGSGGWAGAATVAVPLALALIGGALGAQRLSVHAGVLLGLSFLALGLVGRAGVGSDRAAGALVGVVAGLGAGLVLASLSGVGRTAVRQVVVRQAGGVSGLAAALVAMLVTMRDRLEANLRPIVEAVLVDVPAELKRFARLAAEGALRTLGDGLTAANLAETRRGFAAIVVEQIPNEFRPLVEPYRDALNAAFADALGTGLTFAFLLGAGLALVAVALALAGRLAIRRGAAEELPASR